MTEPPRRRVPVAAEQSVREERRSFFRYAAILGVIVGIPLGVFGLPALLNVFFDEPTVPFNGAHSEDGLTIWVESHEVDEGSPRAASVTLGLRTAEPWAFDPEGVELELSEGDNAPLESFVAPDVFEAGPQGTLVLRFSLAGADDDAEPRALRLAEPKVRFALTEEDH